MLVWSLLKADANDGAPPASSLQQSILSGNQLGGYNKHHVIQLISFLLGTKKIIYTTFAPFVLRIWR